MSLNPIDVISQTFNALKDSYVDTLKYGLLWYLLPASVIYVLLYTIFPILAQPEITAEMLTGVQAGSAIFASIVTSLLGLMYFAYALVRRIQKQHIKFSQATKPALRIVGVYILALLAIMIPAIGVAFLFMASLNIAGALVGLLVFACTVVIMVYLSPVYAEIGMGSGVFESLKNSYNLVKESWWRTFAAILLFSLLVGVAIGVFIPIMFVLGLLTLVVPVLAQVTISILSTVFSIALLPVSVSFTVSLHEKLSEN
jgi:hypothetical protein